MCFTDGGDVRERASCVLTGIGVWFIYDGEGELSMDGHWLWVTYDGYLQRVVLLVLDGTQDVERASLNDALQSPQLPQKTADTLH